MYLNDKEKLDLDFYTISNPDLDHLSHTELEKHWESLGVKENRYPNLESFELDWQKLSLESKFFYSNYLICNPDLNFAHEIEAQIHYLKFGRFENRPISVKYSDQLIKGLSELYNSFAIDINLLNLDEINFDFLLSSSQIVFTPKLLDFDFDISQLRKIALAKYISILDTVPAPSTLSLILELFQRIDRAAKEPKSSLLIAMLRVEIFRLIQVSENSTNRDFIHPIGAPSPTSKNLFQLELTKLKKSRIKNSIYNLIDLITRSFNRIKIKYVKKPPKLSLITSLYNADQFIEPFLKNITSTRLFSRCELIIVDADSPGNELNIIKAFQNEFSNIKYVKTEKRIGIYEAWNFAIRMAQAPYLSNANVDDLHCRNHFSTLIKFLDSNTEIKVAYGNFYYSIEPNIYPWMAKKINIKSKLPLTTKHNLLDFNAPHCTPIWRKSIHNEIGYFDEKFKSAGDWEFWLRAAKCNQKFGQIQKPLSIYYLNPKGISTSSDSRDSIEQRMIRSQYLDLLMEEDQVISIFG